MTLEPSPQQQAIIDCNSNCVVVAMPGSGKTFTIAMKAQAILRTEPSYRGVIAISYTNKASDELRRRISIGRTDLKGSFFGTIDSFLLSEIVFPFAPHLWAVGRELSIVKHDELPRGGDSETPTPDMIANCRTLDDQILPWAIQHLLNGRLVLESIGIIATHILKSSAACRNYLKARYKWIIIDEYQDCGFWQHQIFIILTKYLFIRGMAVGDTNQSIFEFAHKYARYLSSIEQDPKYSFELFRLQENYRSHPSIVAYATKLVDPSYSASPSVITTGQNIDSRVYQRFIVGDERAIGAWIGSALPAIYKNFTVSRPNEIAILVTSKRTANLVSGGLAQAGVSHRVFSETALDKLNSPRAATYSLLLRCLMGRPYEQFEIAGMYVNEEADAIKFHRCIALLHKTSQLFATEDGYSSCVVLSKFMEFAKDYAITAPDLKADMALMDVLNNKENLVSYRPPLPTEISVMTIHKSKGLEFDVVFHLDLYQYILPRYKSSSPKQDINLHYVAITRARSACILCTSTKRHNSSGDLCDAAPSEYLLREDLQTLTNHKA